MEIFLRILKSYMKKKRISGSRSLFKGFTLLEVMIALAILSISLVVLLSAQGATTRATLYIKRMTQAALLFQAKMSQIERKLIKDGFSPDTETDEGDFYDEGFEDFNWQYEIKKIDVPVPSITGQDQVVTQIAGFNVTSGMVSQMMQSVQQVVENQIREVRLTVSWKDGKQMESISGFLYVVRLPRSESKGARINPKFVQPKVMKRIEVFPR